MNDAAADLRAIALAIKTTSLGNERREKESRREESSSEAECALTTQTPCGG